MATTKEELLVLGIILYMVMWSLYNAAALAWREALSSSPFLTLLLNQESQHHTIYEP